MAKNKTQEPQYFISRINTQVLNYGVYYMKGSEKTLYSLICFVLGGLVGLIYYGGLFKDADGVATLWTMISNIVVFVVIGLVAIKAFLPTINESLRKKRLVKLKMQFCDFASALANSLSSGMNMHDALESAYKDLKMQYSDDTFIVLEVEEILNGVRNNISIEEMLEDFGNRSGVSDIVNFATVFATCYRTGGDIKSVVRRSSDIISEKTMISSEIETAMTSNKMQMNIMNILPVVLVLMMRFMSQEFAASYSTLVGVLGLSVSAGMTIAAYKLGQKITDIKG